MYAVYVLFSIKDKRFYVGCTSNLSKRLQEHNNGYVFATKNRLPIKLVYCELCINKYDAYKREKYFKMGYGRRFLKNRLNNYFKEI